MMQLWYVYGMYLYTLPPYDFAYFSGIPGEIAYHGWLFPWTWLLSATLSLIIVGNLFIPIFYKMRLTSVYEVGFLINYGVLSLNSLLESGLPMAVFSIGLLVKSYLRML